jgi:hypothetical protein
VPDLEQSTQFLAPRATAANRVLNAGSGFQSPRQLHPVFASGRWEQIRCDIDPDAKPDIVSSITDMREHVPTGSFDAVWCSHALEHLFSYEVPLAVSEFRRVLNDEGYALIRCPDLEAVASLIIEHGIDHVAYQSPAGPITPLDILFGHSASIAQGRVNMSHKTGFTCARLGKLLVDAGFSDVLVKRQDLELWALALMPKSNQERILHELQVTGLDLREIQP